MDDFIALLEEVQPTQRRRPVFVSPVTVRCLSQTTPPPHKKQPLCPHAVINTPPSCEQGGRPSSCAATPPPVGVVSAELYPTLPMEAELHLRLLPHQQEGVAWLFDQHKSGPGCLLADEMGLGKTVQVAAFLGVLMRQCIVRSTLVVVPASLIEVWTSAFQEWGLCAAHQLHVVHSDKKPARDARWLRMSQQQHSLAPGVAPVIVVTTYGLMKRDVACIRNTKFDYIVLDEAHLIKDPATDTAKAALELRAHHKIALTGTPLMNSFHDIWSLFEFVDPHLLGSDATTFAVAGQAMLRSNERDSAQSERAYGQQQLANLQAKIKPRMLRREKYSLGNTSSLPSATSPATTDDEAAGVQRALWLPCRKLDVVVWVTLTPVQRAQYIEFLNSDVVQLALRQLRVKQPLVLLNALRNIVNHPWLNFSEDNFRDAMATPMAVSESLPEFGDILSSSKLVVGVEIVASEVSPPQGSGDNHRQRKMLVFSRSKRLLDIFGFLLQHRGGVPHVRLDGDVPAAQRGKLVKQFAASDTCHVCLLTTQVGGVGLTFNCASRVLLLDPSWNPASDAQAVDRVHRIGQTSDVIIYRLIAAGTVDEKIYRNQVHKATAAMQLHAPTSGRQQDDDAMPSNAVPSRPEEEVLLDATATPPPPERIQERLHRFFTRQQLRCMFELGDCNVSETAQQLIAVAGGRHEEDRSDDVRRFREVERRIVTLAPNGAVCAVTDHGNIFHVSSNSSQCESSLVEATRGGGANKRGPQQTRHRHNKALRSRNALPTATLSELAEQLDDFDADAFSASQHDGETGPDLRPQEVMPHEGGRRCSILLQGASLEELMRRELSTTHAFFHGVPIRRLNLDVIFAEGRTSVQLDEETQQQVDHFASTSSDDSDDDDDDEARLPMVMDWAAFEDDASRSSRPSLAMRANAARSALLQWKRQSTALHCEGEEAQ